MNGETSDRFSAFVAIKADSISISTTDAAVLGEFAMPNNVNQIIVYFFFIYSQFRCHTHAYMHATINQMKISLFLPRMHDHSISTANKQKKPILCAHIYVYMQQLPCQYIKAKQAGQNINDGWMDARREERRALHNQAMFSESQNMHKFRYWHLSTPGRRRWTMPTMHIGPINLSFVGSAAVVRNALRTEDAYILWVSERFELTINRTTLCFRRYFNGQNGSMQIIWRYTPAWLASMISICRFIHSTFPIGLCVFCQKTIR